MDELKKYMIEGQIQDELIHEMDESNVPASTQVEENEFMKHKATTLVESVLKEFEMAVASADPKVEDPYKDVDPRIKKSQALVRLLQDNLWKLCDSQRKPYHPEDEMDDDIKALMTSNIEPLIKAAANKLHSIWHGEVSASPKPEEKPEEKEDENPVTVGIEVTSPQDESLKVKEILGDKVMVEDIHGTNKIVEKTIVEKWLKG